MATLLVTNTNDSGPGSLRDAIQTANANMEPDVIQFAVTGTITLNTALPLITEDLTIEGPGTGLLEISGNNSVRVFDIGAGVTVQIQDLTVANGSAANGGGFFNRGNLTLIRTRVAGNTGGLAAGAVWSDSGSVLSIQYSTFEGNHSPDVAGAIYSDNSTLIVNASRFVGNTAASFAGAILLDGGMLTITASTFLENSAGDQIGAIAAFDGLMEIRDSAFIRNRAGSLASAIATGVGASTRIINTTLAENISETAGATVAAGVNSFISLSFVTVADNAVEAGAALETFGGQILVKNSIVASTTGGVSCAGNIVNLGGNLSTDATCGFTVVTREQLKLGPPKLNPPGITETMALLPRSAAIDRALDCLDAEGNPVLTDQRGVPRPLGSRCDVGAFEFQPRRRFPPSPRPLFESLGTCQNQRIRRPFQRR